jgi:Fe-S-cluster containining protein
MPRFSLPILDARIEARSLATQGEHPWWPCREGCDACCRSLSRLPVLTRPEWERLAPAIAALDADVRSEISARTEESRAAEHVVCPLLDLEAKRCRVYEARPIACRTYGFYTERDAGLHCAIVTGAIAAHDAAVVWGNGEAIAADLGEHGEAVSLADWLGVRSSR